MCAACGLIVNSGTSFLLVYRTVALDIALRALQSPPLFHQTRVRADAGSCVIKTGVRAIVLISNRHPSDNQLIVMRVLNVGDVDPDYMIASSSNNAIHEQRQGGSQKEF
eukprot:m.164233 g.164233  ORF g.164233 m.164233 type:complete len:109 (-) comp31327_c0_seq3:578-904(-)